MEQLNVEKYETGTDALLAERRGKAGVITLNRPKALCALNQEMTTAMLGVLSAWAADDSVEAVAVTSTSEKALCAGGDIAALYRDALAGGSEGAQFWADEYRLNLMISEYPKPYFPLMQGLVLGGGIGISAHGSHRVVTDSTKIGMPETGIGFFPDVGGTKLLAEAPGNLGLHLALTLVHAGAAEAIAAGLADVYVPQGRIDALLTALAQRGASVQLQEFAAAPPAPFGDARVLVEIAEAYSASTVQEILQGLTTSESEWAQDAAKRIRRNCPLSLEVTKRAIDTAHERSLAEELQREFQMAIHAQRNPNFVEGVRAQIIDKDRNPAWQPDRLEDVEQSDVESFFAPLEDPKLQEMQHSITEGARV